MLLQFSVQNYKAFKDKATLSMVASNYFKEFQEENLVTVGNLKVVKSAVIYGANASGKTKLLDAIKFMTRLVLDSSSNLQIGDSIDVQPFLLNSKSEKLPSEFEIIFQTERGRFRYGFEVNKEKVVSEWLFFKPFTKEIELFYREGDEICVHDKEFSRGKFVVKEKLLRNNALLVSVAAQFNDELATVVLAWFNSLKILNSIKEHEFQGFTMIQIDKDNYFKKRVIDFLNHSDILVHDIKNESINTDDLPKNIADEILMKIKHSNKLQSPTIFSDVIFSYKKFSHSKKEVGEVNFSLRKDESNGTRKLFALAGPILDVLENGYTLVVDELDTQLHPNLVHRIISLFNSSEYNKKNAQLIFNTHNTNLLDEDLFRRDQIWFTEKNQFGEASLYSLSDFKSTEVTKRDSFEKNYLKGSYGAIPLLYPVLE